MAAVFRHGRGATLKFDVLGDANGAVFRDMTVAASCDVSDVTTWNTDVTANDHRYVPSFRGGTLSGNAFFGSTDEDTRFSAALGSEAKTLVTFGPEGDAIGRFALLAQVDETKMDVDAAFEDAIGVAVDFVTNQTFEAGTFLTPELPSRTTTFATTSINSGYAAGTAGKMLGQIHIFFVDTPVTGVRYVIQHSSSNSTWANCIDFGLQTAAAALRSSSVATTVKRYVRATVPPSGFNATAAFATIAFARQGSVKA